MLMAAEKGAELIVSVGSHFNLVEFLEKNRAGMSSTFLTRLRVGEILVDAKGVSRLYRPVGRARPDPRAHAGRVRHVRDRRRHVAEPRRARRPALAQAPGPARDQVAVFDFRYHALSLVAVFLALGIGIVLGASLGDSVVSEANRDVRSSLRGDVVDARNGARDRERAAEQSRRLHLARRSTGWPAAELRRKRVAIVSSGGAPAGASRTRPATPWRTRAGRSTRCRSSTASPTCRIWASASEAASASSARTAAASCARSCAGSGACSFAAVPPRASSRTRLARLVQRRLPRGGRGRLLPRGRRARRRRGALRGGADRGAARGRRAGRGSRGVRHRPVADLVLRGRRACRPSTTWISPPGGSRLVLALGGAKGSFGFKETADAPASAAARSGARGR